MSLCVCVILCVHESSSLCLPLFVPASRDISFVLHFFCLLLCICFPLPFLPPALSLFASSPPSMSTFLSVSWPSVLLCLCLVLSFSLPFSPSLLPILSSSLCCFLFSFFLSLLLLLLLFLFSLFPAPFSSSSFLFLSLSLSHSKILCDSAPITSFHLK